MLGTVPTSANLPASGDVGDSYLAEDTGRLWTWTAASPPWVDMGQIQGPEGPAGAAGSAGSPGTPGQAATVTVGTTTTGPAAVTNSGTTSAAVLNFTVPQGPAGTAGTNGAPGAAATVAVGTVQTGAAGTTASVLNSGTTSAAVLNFTIPRGDVGATGPAFSPPATTGSGSTFALQQGPTLNRPDVSDTLFIATAQPGVGQDFWLGRTGGGAGLGARVLNWTPQWYDAWSESTGNRIIVNAGTPVMSLTGTGNATFAGSVAAAGIVTSSGTVGGVVMGGGGNINATMGTVGTAAFANNGNVAPIADNAFGCGIPGAAWFQVAAYNFPQQSDPRLKKDIVDAAPGALATVAAIPVRNYRWKSEADDAPLHIGWNATEVQSVLGNVGAVVAGDDEKRTLALNGNEMTALLWQAVQELSAEVAAMKGER